MAKEERKRNYACVLYEESVPENFVNIIEDWHVPALLSPYHDKDINANNTTKKPHWHLMIMFDSLKTETQARDLFSMVNGVGCEVINSMRGYARYLCHLDNPDKSQYEPEYIKEFSGADYNLICMLETDYVKLTSEVQAFIKENDIYSFAELLDYCVVHKYSWYRMLSNHKTLVIKEYLKSRQWEKDTLYKRADIKENQEGG